jgi:hypothetical protein
MSRPARLTIHGLVVVVAVGCGPAAEDVEGRVTPGAHLISDGAHNGGTPGFFFRPPMVPDVRYGGTFEPGLRPEVTIDRKKPGSGDVEIIAQFTKSAGTFGATVTESVEQQQYQVDWNTGRYRVSNGVYRIHVRLENELFELGFADVMVVANARAARAVDASQFVPLINGTTLPIKFRIETEALRCVGVRCTAQDECHVAGSCDTHTWTCSNPIAPPGTPCTDGDACTQGDTCAAGVCVGGSPVTCPAPDACHLAVSCDPGTGTCPPLPPAPDGTPCPDGECAGGACVAAGCALGTCAITGAPCRFFKDCPEPLCVEDPFPCGVPCTVRCEDPCKWTLPTARFVANPEGTVTDRLTCLDWEKKTGDVGGYVVCPGGTTCEDPHDVRNVYRWSTGPPWDFDGSVATEFLAQLNGPPGFAGHTDWRLPEVFNYSAVGSSSLPPGSNPELESILSGQFPSCTTSPCIDPIFGPTDPQAAYWSSSTAYPDAEFVGCVWPKDGSSGLCRKGGGSLARAVRDRVARPAAVPVLQVSSASLSFVAVPGGPDPASQDVTVTSAATEKIARPVVMVRYFESPVGWLTATVLGTSEPYTVRVAPKVGSLDGSYAAEVAIASFGAANSPVVLLATFRVRAAGTPDSIEAASTTFQTGNAGQPADDPPAVRVRDAEGRPVAGTTVTFAVVRGGGLLVGADTLTGADGIARVTSWTLGPSGPQTVRATAPGLQGSPVTFDAVVGGGPYAVTLRLLTPPTDAQLHAFELARARAEQVIVGDLPDVPLHLTTAEMEDCGAGPAIDETVDDLLLLARIRPIDGPGGVLGRAAPCVLRADSLLPALGFLELDADDVASLEASGRLEVVALHEMLHVVGLGSLWQVVDPALLSGAGTADPIFTGLNARDAFLNYNGGVAYPGTPVPVENTGRAGTRDAHWREAGVFENELMTGWITGTTQPPSRTTAGSLLDLGYQVDLSASDPFDIATAGLRAAAEAGRVAIGDDVLRVRLRIVDAGGRVRPLP